MLTGYSTISGNNLHKKNSLSQSKDLKNSSSLYERTKGNTSLLTSQQKYSKKSCSYDKLSLHKKMNSMNIHSTSTSKQIEGKKLASSQYTKSSIKTEGNTSFSMAGNHSSFLNQRNQTQYLNESKSNVGEIKDRIIAELKANFSQDKLRRRKILTVNTDCNDNLNSFYETKDISQLNKSNYFTSSKKDQPFKLYGETKSNDDSAFNISFSKGIEPIQSPTHQPLQQPQINSKYQLTASSTEYLNSGNYLKTSSSINTKPVVSKNQFNTLTQTNISKQMNDIELKMDLALKQNTTNSKSKKYNTIKNYFEETIEAFPKLDNNRLLQKILIGYHEVVSSFSTENKDLSKSNIYLNNKLEKMNQTLFEYQKRNINQQNEINQLKMRIAEMEKTQEQIISKSTQNSTQAQPESGPEKVKEKGKEKEENMIDTSINKTNNRVFDLNKKNIGDLDALYFYDKVNMLPRTSSFSYSKVIPKLNINK